MVQILNHQDVVRFDNVSEFAFFMSCRYFWEGRGGEGGRNGGKNLLGKPRGIIRLVEVVEVVEVA